jgi:hypothetical protein
MGSLRRRPMLLSYIDDLMAIENNGIVKGEYSIYNALVDSWLRRELKKNLRIKDLHDACLILAVWMQSHKKRTISKAVLGKLIEKIAKVKTITRIEMKGRSLLNRTSEGDYRFFHYSIQEFCAAQFIYQRPLYLPNGKISVTHQIVRMLVDSGIRKIEFDAIDLSLINQPIDVQKKIKKNVNMEFVFISPGIFRMGSSAE